MGVRGLRGGWPLDKKEARAGSARSARWPPGRPRTSGQQRETEGEEEEKGVEGERVCRRKRRGGKHVRRKKKTTVGAHSTQGHDHGPTTGRREAEERKRGRERERGRRAARVATECAAVQSASRHVKESRKGGGSGKGTLSFPHSLSLAPPAARVHQQSGAGKRGRAASRRASQRASGATGSR